MAETKTSGERNYSIDAMRIIAILAVIIIHTTTRNLEIVSLDLKNNLLALFLNQIARFTIPMFFMISGFALEISSPTVFNYGRYFKRRISRIFIPYIFWSAIYYFLVYKNHSLSFWSSLLSGNASYQLYFIPTLLVFYFVFPVAHHYYSFIRQKWLLVLLGIAEIIVVYNDYFHHSIRLFSPIAVALFNYFPFIIGMVAAHHHDRLIGIIRSYKIWWLLATLALGGYVFYEGYHQYYLTYNYLAFYSQWRPSVLLYTFFMSSWLYFGLDKAKRGGEKIKKISQLTFPVFFVHVIVLELTWRYLGPTINPLIFFAIVALISFAVAKIFHKIPYLQVLTG